MSWIERSPILQSVNDDIQETLTAHGWQCFLAQRLYSGHTISKPPDQFAEVRLFKAIGSDGQIRFLGMVASYDKSMGDNFNDNGLVDVGSDLGRIGVGDGVRTNFNLKVYPNDPQFPFEVLFNNLLISSTQYTLYPNRGVIVFTDPPALGVEIAAVYSIGRTARDPSVKFIFFTFNSVFLERDNKAKILGIGDGEQLIFEVTDVVDKPWLPGTVFVHVDNEEQIIDIHCAVDLINGRVQFFTPPPEGAVVLVDFAVAVGASSMITLSTNGDGVRTIFSLDEISTSGITQAGTRVFINNTANELLSGWTIDINTNELVFDNPPINGARILVMAQQVAGGLAGVYSNTLTYIPDTPSPVAFNGNNTSSVMNAVYSSLRYSYPSLPTVISLTSTGQLDRTWQRDSLFHWWGQVNPDRIVLFFRLDPGGSPEKALYAPLYIGKLCMAGNKEPRRNTISIGGCAETDEITWSLNKKLGNNFVDYGTETGNGNTKAVLHQSIGGIYYQSCYLAFITHDRNVDNDDGRFAPSRYTNKYHISRMYLAHPNDGFVGYLDDCYAVHPKGIFQNDEVEIDEVIENELIGIGDGITKKYYLSHRPYLEDEGYLNITFNCVSFNGNYDFNEDNRVLEFEDAPPEDVEIIATYTTRQIYRFNITNTARSPYVIGGSTPFAPIGLAIFKGLPEIPPDPDPDP